MKENAAIPNTRPVPFSVNINGVGFDFENDILQNTEENRNETSVFVLVDFNTWWYVFLFENHMILMDSSRCHVMEI